MTSPRVIDNDRDEITVTLDGKEIRGWSYASEAERRTKMLAAREFCEGWYQASRRAAQPVVKALREAIEFADQDTQALTPVGKAMVDRWRAAIHTGLPNYAGWRSIDTAPEDCRVILAAVASTPPNLSGEQNVSRQYDAKQSVLAAYPENTEAGVYLFLEILNIDESDFVYEEGITIAEYIYGPRPAPPTKQEG